MRLPFGIATGDPHDVAVVFGYKISILVDQCLPRSRRVLLIHTENDRLLETVAALLQKLAYLVSDQLGTFIQDQRPVGRRARSSSASAVWAAMAFAALGDAKRAWELFIMIDPVNHAKSPDAIAVYKTEPYVLAADVYVLAPHTGRGGWTWYTGSAGWMYQFILESLLGLRLEADKLHFSPCMPTDWTAFEVRYRYRETVYHITVRQTSVADGGPRLMVNGVKLPGAAITMVDDRRQHVVEVRIPAAPG